MTLIEARTIYQYQGRNKPSRIMGMVEARHQPEAMIEALKRWPFGTVEEQRQLFARKGYPAVVETDKAWWEEEV